MSADRSTGRDESLPGIPLEDDGRSSGSAADYYRFSPGRSRGGRRLTVRVLAAMRDDLSERDWQVLRALGRVRVLSGAQAERLLFADVTPASRGRTRRRVLGRLVALGLVATLERRIGGVRAGSAGLVYVLSGGGQRLLAPSRATGAGPRPRTPSTPGRLFLAHALAISETYVCLVEATRDTPGVTVPVFAVESDARWDTPEAGEVLRPDALVVLARGGVEDVWWLEIDRGTESLPRLKRLLDRYLRFAQAGRPGPRGVIPRVLFSVTTGARQDALQRLVERGPDLGRQLFVVCQEADVAQVLLDELLQASKEEPP